MVKKRVNSERVNSESLVHSFAVRRGVLFIYLVGMLILVVLPLNDTKASFLSDTYVIKLRLDYLIHVIIFLPFILLVKLSYPINISNIIIIGLVFAGICEGIQYLLPYRSINVNDLVANMIGISLGVVFLLPVFDRLHRSVKR